MNLTPEQVADIFADVKPALMESLKKELAATIEWNAKDSLSRIVSAEVAKWCEENIIPSIRERLADSKEGILAAVIPATESIATELGKALAETLAKNLAAGSYKRSTIFKALFD
jgi:vacuolar-type H+-ATPase subunit C/Vma6